MASSNISKLMYKTNQAILRRSGGNVKKLAGFTWSDPLANVFTTAPSYGGLWLLTKFTTTTSLIQPLLTQEGWLGLRVH